MDQKNSKGKVTRGIVVVWGLLASYPFGGMTWQALHYVEGLRRLGYDVWYVEDSPTSVLNPRSLWRTTEYEENLEYLARQMEAIGLTDRWIFRAPVQGGACYGARDAKGLASLYREADAVLNVCGAHYLREDHAGISCLIYLQTDPFVDQVRVAEDDTWLIGQFDAHTHLFTYGENLGAPDCLVPVLRYKWNPTRPPVVLDWWTTGTTPPARATLTTISTWKNLGKDVSWQGQTYHWRKDLEFRKFIDLPKWARLPIELSLEGIPTEDAAEMRSHGWGIRSARDLTDPAAYHTYICSSAGEFTVAKDQYVRTRSGWFSDRSVCYLAAGRPVVTQETGFSKFIPTGEGLFSFSSMEEASEAINKIAGDYERHSKAALDIAHEYFSVERVLAAMLTRIGLL
jgi:hypothetical protein